MARKRHTEEQIIAVLGGDNRGTKNGDILNIRCNASSVSRPRRHAV